MMENLCIFTGIKCIIQIYNNTSDLIISESGQVFDLISGIKKCFPDDYLFIEKTGDLFINSSRNDELQDQVRKWNESICGKNNENNNILKIGDMLKEFLSKPTSVSHPIAVIFDALPIENANEIDRKSFFNKLYWGASYSCKQENVNTVVIIMRENISPLKENNYIHNESISLPDQKERSDYLHSQYEEDYSDKLVAITEGMMLRDLSNIVSYKNKANIDILKAADHYMFCTRTNPFLQCRNRFKTWESIYEQLKKRIFGQDKLLEYISKKIFVRIHIDSRKPLTFFLIGNTGCGKTESAKAIAELLFGSEEHLFRYDMASYNSEESIWNLIGSPAGYVNHNDGIMANNVKSRPFSVHLFDEIEKADKELISKIFLSIIDDGVLNANERLNFSNTIIIFTSNIAYSTNDIICENDEEETERVNKIIDEKFRPEFLGRLKHRSQDTAIVRFSQLSNIVVRDIINKKISEIEKISKESSMEITFDNSAREFISKMIVSNGFEDTYGARNLEAVIETIKTNAYTRIGELGDRVIITNRDDKIVAIKIIDGTESGEFDL